MLVQRDDVTIRRLGFPLPDGIGVHRIEILHELLAMGGRQVEDGIRGGFLVFDDISQAPPSAFPRIEKIGSMGVTWFFRTAIPEAAPGQEDGCSQPGAGRLRKNTQHVVPYGRPGHDSLKESIETAARFNPLESLILHVGYHMLAQHVHFRIENGVDVEVHRIDIGRYEKTGPRTSHLMLVVHDFGKPFVV